MRSWRSCCAHGLVARDSLQFMSHISGISNILEIPLMLTFYHPSFKNLPFRGWRDDGSTVMSTSCSSRGPLFNSQHLNGGSQPAVTPISGHVMASLACTGTTCMWYAHVCRQNTHKHKIRINKIIKVSLIERGALNTDTYQGRQCADMGWGNRYFQDKDRRPWRNKTTDIGK